MKKRNLFEELNIKGQDEYVNGALDIDIQNVKQRVHSAADSAYTERKPMIMKSKKKYLAIAAAAVLTLGITAFAANGMIANWFSSSSSKPEYTSLPTVQQVTKDIGYTPVLIDSFENGYVFKSGSVVNNNLTDKDGKSIERFKSVSFDYEKNGDEVIFAQDKFSSETEPTGDVVGTVNGAAVYYYSYVNKSVPADYKLTEADKKAEADGKLVFSYGSPNMKIQTIQSVTWLKGGMQYQLMQISGKLTADELFEMAKEVLSK